MASTDVVRIAKDLVDIRSESLADGEGDVARYISGYLKGIGIASETIEFQKGRFNVIATAGKGDGLMLNGHMDTVPIGDAGKWRHGTQARVSGGRLYGRGSTDMKGGIAAMLSALTDFDYSKSKRRLALAFVGDEEMYFRGSAWLLRNRKSFFRNVRYGMISEPTDLGLQIAQKGILSMTIEVRGKGAHGSTPWMGKNAIVGMSKFIEELDKLSGKLGVTDRLLGKGTINVGQIQGGTAPNVVPDYCEIKVDRRLVPGETAKGALSDIERILKSLKLDYRMEITITKPPFKLDGGSYLPRFLSGIVPGGYVGMTGYTEAELYKSMSGMDCVVFGPGTKKSMHQADEYVSISSLRKCRDYYSRIIRKWCGDSP